jgi:hypothetical protein
METMTAHNVLKLIKSYICENQQKLSQYNFLVNEKHKALKEALNALSGEESLVGHGDVSQVGSDKIETEKRNLVSSLLDLENYLTGSFEKECVHTFEHAIKYFQARSDVLPRASVKVIVDQKLAILSRFPDLSYPQASEVSLEENSAFVKIAAGDSFFLSNDIPKCVESKEYFNEKLNIEKVVHYNQERERMISMGGDHEELLDDLWRQCWQEEVHDGLASTRDMQACYRSSLVIPMSLSADSLTKEFSSRFGIDRGSIGVDKEVKRLVFGFLCFDHQQENFFTDDDDVNFVYIMADILSLYLVQQLIYTQYSSVYAAAINVHQSVVTLNT